jgi:cyclopropane-fatty-acyl-phospholipid synthase
LQAVTAAARSPYLLSAFVAALAAGYSCRGLLASDTKALRDLIKQYTRIAIVGPGKDEAAEAAAKKDGLVVWKIKDEDVLRRVLTMGGLGFAESYMDGEWEPGSPEQMEELIYEMLELETAKKDLGLRVLPLASAIFVGAVKWKLFPGNNLSGAKSNIANTYDYLDDNRIYEKMLGPTMQYTCAYYHEPGMTLDEAQRAKMRMIAEKLQLKPGMKVLEFGFGFGAQAYFLASEYGVHVTGATLSERQMEWAKKHNAHPNIEYRLQDYRTVEGKFDRIYSVGMFEHVGRNSYKAYFDKCYELLEEDGIMLLHTMGWARRGPWNHNAFINKYIFPGGELPTMSHLTQEFTDRWHLEDWHSFGKSYTQTLRDWIDNLENWKGMDEFDERFRRMWEYYLNASAASFYRRRVKLWQQVWTKMNNPRARPDDCNHIRAIDPKILK